MCAKGLDPNIDLYKLKLLEISVGAAEYFKSENAKCKASRVFVIFNEQNVQSQCLKDMCVGKLFAILDIQTSIAEKFHFRGQVLNVDEAPEVRTLLYTSQKLS